MEATRKLRARGTGPPAPDRLLSVEGWTVPVSAAGLAELTGLGRSTVTAALAALERQGRARRTRGRREGSRIFPDLWEVTASPAPEGSEDVHAAAEAVGDKSMGPAAQAVPVVREATGPENAEKTVQDEVVPASASTREARRNPGGDVRLKPGQLSGLALGHLRGHPDDEFTAGEIARVLKRSAGAVSNALERFALTGEAVRTSERPRKYRAA